MAAPVYRRGGGRAARVQDRERQEAQRKQIEAEGILKSTHAGAPRPEALGWRPRRGPRPSRPVVRPAGPR